MPSRNRRRFRTRRVCSACRFPSGRSEEHTSELQSQSNLVCRLLLEKKKTELSAEPENSRSTAPNTIRRESNVTTGLYSIFTTADTHKLLSRRTGMGCSELHASDRYMDGRCDRTNDDIN